MGCTCYIRLRGVIAGYILIIQERACRCKSISHVPTAFLNTTDSRMYTPNVYHLFRMLHVHFLNPNQVCSESIESFS
uniref:Uncharacterized protein n=1 Tax=Daphnia magna TaxID=35525 RepID=A0A0N8DU07_9CRUS